ncbi:helix-turn-helix transcriptional regulator [Nocardia sp. NEAU-G5]|uniref:Helix-turn-helix transcriptional regulator n=1 Tax=Nocardia albiluteola TaxID=2842303 RepID=A0ABS6BCF3_9NOCA|nr:helix-turn-helix transcriptional regulator [Nocardia albiluteola]MBU3067455.1 helix-turn-helix transcriptional regulator [Nocardia albiluteola]
MTVGSTRREELRDFLRNRRARLAPEDVGLSSAGRRRTPGLRREEVALTAGVGVSWYTWLEQGRDISVSADVLDAVARALRLDGPERAHLYVLAGMNPPLPGEDSPTAITPEIRQVLDAWEPRPAVLRDRYWNVLAFNDSARSVFGYGGTGNNCLVTYFTNPCYTAMREFWAAEAPAVVAAYRADAARAPEDPEFRRVVDDLRDLSPEFARLWDRHEVGVAAQAINALRHPEAGELFFDATTLTVADHPCWHLVLYHPHAGTATVERLDGLRRLRLAAPRLA